MLRSEGSRRRHWSFFSRFWLVEFFVFKNSAVVIWGRGFKKNGGDRGTRNRLASGDNPEEPIKTQKFRPIRFDKSNVWTNQILNKIRPRVNYCTEAQQLWNNFCKKSNNFARQGFLVVWPAFNTLIRTKIPFKTWVRCVLNVNLFFCVFTYQIVFEYCFCNYFYRFWHCFLIFLQHVV